MVGALCKSTPYPPNGINLSLRTIKRNHKLIGHFSDNIETNIPLWCHQVGNLKLIVNFVDTSLKIYIREYREPSREHLGLFVLNFFNTEGAKKRNRWQQHNQFLTFHSKYSSKYTTMYAIVCRLIERINIPDQSSHLSNQIKQLHIIYFTFYV